MIRVLIADDHYAMRDGLALLLGKQAGIDVAAVVPDGKSAVERLRQGDIDVALIDMDMPGMTGDEVIRVVTQGDGCASRMLIYSGFMNEQLVRRALEAGASGYLQKDAGMTQIMAFIQAVNRGEVCLCPEALALVGEDVVTEAVRNQSERAFKVSPEQIVEEFLAAELLKVNPEWPEEIRSVYRRVVESVPDADVSVRDILRDVGVRWDRRQTAYCTHVGSTVKHHQVQLRLRLARRLQDSGLSLNRAAMLAGYNSPSALCHARRREKSE